MCAFKNELRQNSKESSEQKPEIQIAGERLRARSEQKFREDVLQK
jgi:hypothetical protein